MQRIPDSHYDLFEKPAIGHLATLMPDGSPQVTPVWVDFDGEFVLVNTAVGRQKTRNIKRSPQVAIDILDPDDPFRWLAVRGEVVEITEAGANENRDKLSMRYMGRTRPLSPHPDDRRVILKIAPMRVTASG